MKKIKKLTIWLFLTVLLVSSTFTNTTTAKAETHELEILNVEELDNHPDVKAYLEEKGIEEKLIVQEDHSPEELYQLFYSKEPEPEFINGLDKETRKRIAEKYQLDKYGIGELEPKVLQLDQLLLVRRNAETMVFDGVIGINIFVNNTGVDLAVVELDTGFSSVDRITGTVTKYNLDGKRWKEDDDKRVSASNVRAGIFFSWSESRNAVSDYFEYDLKITDNGYTLTYTNKGEISFKNQRYLFEVGRYNDRKFRALGGERHHFVSASSLNKAGFDSSYAPCIRMMERDHEETPNYGSKSAAQRFRDKEVELLKEQRYQELIDMEVEGLYKARDPEKRYDNLARKYKDAIYESIWLYEKYFGMDQ